jgi:hypothetical protein
VTQISTRIILVVRVIWQIAASEQQDGVGREVYLPQCRKRVVAAIFVAAKSGASMQKLSLVVLIFLIIALGAWVVVDAFYWGSTENFNLFPHPRYFVLAIIGIATVAVLAFLIFICGKILSKKTRRSG